MMKYRGNKKGFTLVEIIVVLVILAILAAIAVPSVLGYVQEAKDSRILADLRESMIAAQVTFVKSTTFEEAAGTNVKRDNFMTDDQMEDLQRYLHLENKPYVLFYGAGDKEKYGNGAPETCKVYCIIFQETKDSKPWYYDGKQWSHRYLWTNDVNNANPGKDNSRPMYTQTENGRDKNYMNGIKDSNGEDVRVSMYYGYCYGKNARDGYKEDIWNQLKKASD